MNVMHPIPNCLRKPFGCDRGGRLPLRRARLALNSYENRVYQIGIEEAEPVVAKFYRPARWSDAAIARSTPSRRTGGAGDSGGRAA
jgi:hypothetical protein